MILCILNKTLKFSSKFQKKRRKLYLSISATGSPNKMEDKSNETRIGNPKSFETN